MEGIKANDSLEGEPQAFNARMVYEVTSASTALSRATTKSTKKPYTGKGEQASATQSNTPKAAFPVGSCTNHPSSTTHTTEMCKAGKK